MSRSIEKRDRGHGHRHGRRRLALAGFVAGVALIVGSHVVRADDSERFQVHDEDIPYLGLPGKFHLGLPGVDLDVYESRWNGRPVRNPLYGIRDARLRGWYVPRGAGLRDPRWRSWSGEWYPWTPAPQTIRRKSHRETGHSLLRLGLHYNYPDSYPPERQRDRRLRLGWGTDSIGLQLPRDAYVDEYIDEAETLPPVEVDLELEAALVAFGRGEYAEAVDILGRRIKEGDVNLETFVIVAEVLTAGGKFKAASRFLLHGIHTADTLIPLEGVRIREHFPSAELFEERLGELRAEVARRREEGQQDAGLEFLLATWRLLDGDNAAMERLGELQDGGLAKKPARRLYLHFVDRLLESPSRQ